MREEKKKNIPVNIRHLEQAYGFELHQFESGVTYPLAKLMDALGFMKPGRSKITRGGNKD
jgi:hypothetical protein